MTAQPEVIGKSATYGRRAVRNDICHQTVRSRRKIEKQQKDVHAMPAMNESNNGITTTSPRPIINNTNLNTSSFTLRATAYQLAQRPPHSAWREMMMTYSGPFSSLLLLSFFRCCALPAAFKSHFPYTFIKMR